MVAENYFDHDLQFELPDLHESSATEVSQSSSSSSSLSAAETTRPQPAVSPPPPPPTTPHPASAKNQSSAATAGTSATAPALSNHEPVVMAPATQTLTGASEPSSESPTVLALAAPSVIKAAAEISEKERQEKESVDALQAAAVASQKKAERAQRAQQKAEADREAAAKAADEAKAKELQEFLANPAIVENKLAIFWGLGSDNDPRTVKFQGTKRNSNSTSFNLCVHPTGSSVCYKYPITRVIPQGIVDVTKSDLYERPVAHVNTSVYVELQYGVVAGSVSKLVAVKSKVLDGVNSWKYEISQTTSLDDVLQVHPSKKKAAKAAADEQFVHVLDTISPSSLFVAFAPGQIVLDVSGSDPTRIGVVHSYPSDAFRIPVTYLKSLGLANSSVTEETFFLRKSTYEVWSLFLAPMYTFTS